MEKLEIWRDIPNYKGLYQVSNLGRVKSLDRIRFDKNGRKLLFKGKILKPGKNRDGYVAVNLSKNCMRKYGLVHRLVLATFKEESELSVNHIDFDVTNNNLNNLEYLSHAENVAYSARAGRMCLERVQINVTNKNTKESRIFDSMGTASHFIGKCRCYISNYIKLGKHENEEYLWRKL